MASSDDEDERLPVAVSDYSFVDDNDEPISFSVLQLIWDDADSFGGSVEKIGLNGSMDNGLQKIFEQVIAWKFDLSFAKPEIFVLTQKKKWIKLLKPRKSFEETIKTILITVHCLHFVKRNPDTTGKALWDYLSRSFSHYEPRPTENDLVDHFNLTSEAVRRDEILAESQVLNKFLEDKPKKKKVFDEEIGTKPMSGFIDDVIEGGGDGSDDEEEDFYEHVCAICDNGGDILPCEGRCLRSFHATEAAGADSGCDSLGFSDEQVKAIGTFECKNCQYKQHQCYCCGKLGSSDKLAGAQVFQCVTGTCGYFYHPNCVAEALKFKHGDESKDREAEIAAGKPFMCPLHFCYVCKEIEPESETDLQMQFAVCRRCPRAYHRKCLPRRIAFEADEDENIVQRAWEGLMLNKILIYCLKHEIDDELETPVRNHIMFPDTEQKKKKQTLESTYGVTTSPKRRPLSPEGHKKTTVGKPLQSHEKLSASNKGNNSSSRQGKSLVPDSLRKSKLLNKSKVALKKNSSGAQQKDSAADRTSVLGEQLYAFLKDFEPVNLEKGDNSCSKELTSRGKLVTEETADSMILDDDSRKRIDSIIRDTEASIKLEDVKRKRSAPSTHVYSAKYSPQNITLGKVEGLIEAIHAALQKLERGGSLEDAKALCKPGLLSEIARWKSKLRVYLAPFLYGMRYTSFGRHFTKVDKLQAIVDKLHWYVEEGDMIVDFCCGANDFSCLMKKKLDEVGKSCSYKNYDILQAKNDFNFEKKDWMTVRISDLPEGKKLIMGLNPPFGVNAGLANKFIDKALEFKPKLLILIVPPETERLDKKRTPYDLVWEDHDLLAGKAFYLPGSVDVSEKRLEDWNVTAPPLSLWSRPDWTAKHKAVAQNNGHLSCGKKAIQSNICRYDKGDANFMPQAHELCQQSSSVAGGDDAIQDGLRLKGTQNNHGRGREQENVVLEKGNNGGRKRKRGSEENSSEERCSKSGGRSASSSLMKPAATQSRNQIDAEGHRNEQGNVNPEKGSTSVRKHGRVSEEKSSERRSLPRHSSPSKSGDRLAGSYLAEFPGVQSNQEVRAYQHFDRESRSGSQPLHQGYSGFEGEGITRRNNYGEDEFMNCQVEHKNYRSYGSYMRSTNEAYGKEAELRAQVRMFGQQDPDPFLHRDSYAAASPRFPSSYGHLGPTGVSAYTSTMQRYAPRLDELNPRRMNGGTVPPPDFPGTSSLNYNGTPHTRMRNDSLGFAPGPYHPYSQHSSSGWLNE